MQLTTAVAVISVLQAVSALPSLFEVGAQPQPRSLDIEDLVYRRDVIAPLFRRMSPRPTIDYTSGKHGYTNPASSGSTIDSKMQGPNPIPDQLHPLPAGQSGVRPDMTGHGNKQDQTVMDHQIPVGTREGDAATRAGNNNQMLVPSPQQNSEGGITNSAFAQSRAQNPTNPGPVDVRIDGQKPSQYGGGGGGPPSSNTRSKRDLERHVYARSAAADAYAEALAVFDTAVEMEIQRRDALAFADPEIFVSEGGYDYYY